MYRSITLIFHCFIISSMLYTPNCRYCFACIYCSVISVYHCFITSSTPWTPNACTILPVSIASSTSINHCHITSSTPCTPNRQYRIVCILCCPLPDFMSVSTTTHAPNPFRQSSIMADDPVPSNSQRLSCNTDWLVCLHSVYIKQ